MWVVKKRHLAELAAGVRIPLFPQRSQTLIQMTYSGIYVVRKSTAMVGVVFQQLLLTVVHVEYSGRGLAAIMAISTESS